MITTRIFLLGIAMTIAAAPRATANPVSAAPSNEALAGQIPAGGLTADDVVAWLQSAGYRAGAGGGARGYRVVSYINDHPFSVKLNDCDAGQCTSLQFIYGMADQSYYSRRILTSGMVDSWNSANPLIKIRVNGDPTNKLLGRGLNFDVQLSPGDTYTELNNVLALWAAGVERFYDFVEMGASPAASMIRPRIAQDLQDARRFENGMSMHANHFAALNKIQQAEAVPNQTPEEKLAVDELKGRLTGDNSTLNGDPYKNTPDL